MMAVMISSTIMMYPSILADIPMIIGVILAGGIVFAILISFLRLWQDGSEEHIVAPDQSNIVVKCRSKYPDEKLCNIINEFIRVHLMGTCCGKLSSHVVDSLLDHIYNNQQHVLEVAYDPETRGDALIESRNTLACMMGLSSLILCHADDKCLYGASDICNECMKDKAFTNVYHGNFNKHSMATRATNLMFIDKVVSVSSGSENPISTSSYIDSGSLHRQFAEKELTNISTREMPTTHAIDAHLHKCNKPSISSFPSL